VDGSSKQLLIVFHSQSGNTRRLAQAALAGAKSFSSDNVSVTLKQAFEASPEDLLQCQGLILGTPENFGYMSGGLKDFFDRTFYAVEGKIAVLPYAILISAGNDGSGAVRAIHRIANGYPFKEVQPPLICVGEVSRAHLQQSHDLGMAFAVALDAGIF